MPPLEPPRLPARYRLQGPLGAGGHGSVWRALDLKLDRPVAIKVLTGGTATDSGFVERFRREAALTSRIQHPHVVRVLEHGILAVGLPFVAYELVEGSSLADRAARSRPGRDELVRWARQIGTALAEVHRAGVVHRDVKPGNILVRPDGDAVLADFGLARMAVGGTALTAEGLLLGTPPFMAPELWRGEPAGPASDQFAWAASLYQLATGRMVYGAEEPAAILGALGKAWSAPPEPVGLPGLGRALDPDPAARHPDMAAFAEAVGGAPAATSRDAPTLVLGRGLAPVAAVTPMAAVGAGRPGPGRPVLPALAALLVLGVALVSSRAKPPDPDQAPPAPASADPWPELRLRALALMPQYFVAGRLGVEPVLAKRVDAIRGSLDDVHLVTRWFSFLGALETALEEDRAPDGRLPPRAKAALDELLLGFFLRVGRDLEAAHAEVIQDQQDLVLAGKVGVEGAEKFGILLHTGDELLAACVESAGKIGALRPDPDGRVLMAEGILRALAEAPSRRGGILARVAAAAAALPVGPEAGRLAVALRELSFHAATRRDLECVGGPVPLRVLADLSGRLAQADLPPGFSRETLTLEAGLGLARMRLVCPGATEPADGARAMGLLAPFGRFAPSRRATDSTYEVSQAMAQLGHSPEADMPIRDRLRQLATDVAQDGDSPVTSGPYFTNR